MKNLIENYNTKEKEFNILKEKIETKLKDIIDIWNQVYPFKKYNLEFPDINNKNNNIINISYEIIDNNFNITSFEKGFYYFDYDVIEKIDKKTISIPMEFVNNLEFFKKHLPFVQELFELRKKRSSLKNSKQNEEWKLTGIIDKEIGEFDKELIKKSKKLGFQISQIIKNNGDASKLIIENKEISLAMKEFKNIKKQKINEYVEKHLTIFLTKNEEELKIVNERINVLEKLLGNGI